MPAFIQNLIFDLFGNNAHICTFVASMLPIIEVKGAIPLGTNAEIWANPLSIWNALLYSILGSLCCVILLFVFLQLVKKMILQSRKIRNIYDSLKNKISSSSKQIGLLNTPLKQFALLSIFTLIPLPFTGYYSSCLLASVCNLKTLPSILSISVGNILCGLMIAGLSSISPTINLILFYIFLFAFLIFLLYIMIVLKTTLKK